MKADLEQLENKGRLNMFQTAFVFYVWLCFNDVLIFNFRKGSYLIVTFSYLKMAFSNSINASIRYAEAVAKLSFCCCFWV